MMIAFALSKGDAQRAKDVFWNMPLQQVWMQMWCYYQYNGTKIKRIHSEDTTADIE